MARPDTVAEKLLYSAYQLEAGGQRPFSAEDLTVAAWREFPDVFGLLGFADDDGRLIYPNSHRVVSEIVGSKPLRKRGLLKKVGQKQYQLTESGLSLGSRLGVDPDRSEKTGLHRSTQNQLRRLLDSSAAEKFAADAVDDITFHDACGFWGITPRSKAIQLASQVTNIETILREAGHLAGDGTLSFEHGGPAFTGGQVRRLQDLNGFLKDRFEDSLAIIRERTHERKK